MQCDPQLIFELISAIIDAARSGSEVEIYRQYNILRNYLKGKKCPKEYLNNAVRILESVLPEVSESRRLILSEVIEGIKKIRPSSRRKKKTTSRRTRKSRKR